MRASAPIAQRPPRRPRKPTGIQPSSCWVEAVVPNEMPDLVSTHAFTKQDELLAQIRYHRLIERYTGIPCYSLGTHLRARVRGRGEVEVDELYVGVNWKGERYVFPVQARVAPDTFDLVQYERGRPSARHGSATSDASLSAPYYRSPGRSYSSAWWSSKESWGT